MSKQCWSIAAVILASAFHAACSDNRLPSGGAGAGGAASVGGTGGSRGTRDRLPECERWPDPKGPAFSLPLRWPSSFESVQRAANGVTLYAVGTWMNAGLDQRTLIRSLDDAHTWCPLRLPGSPLSVMPAPANDLVLWAITGSTSPGATDLEIVRSVDGGATWRSARGDLPPDVEPQSILSVGSNDEDVAWIATNEAFSGAAATRDGGRTWQRITLPPALQQSEAVDGRIAIDPLRPERIVVQRSTIHSQSGMWKLHLLRSVDWGVTWAEAPLPAQRDAALLSLLAIDTASTLFAASSANLLWRWKADDADWVAVSLPAGTDFRAPILVNGGSAGHLLIASGDTPPARLWETVDSGDSWEAVVLPDGFDPRRGSELFLAGPAEGQVLLSTPIGLQATRSAGSSWTAREVLPASASQLVVSRADPDVIWAITPVQALRSSDGGQSWTPLPSTRGYVGIADDPLDARSAFAIDGTNTFRTTDEGHTWQELAPNRAAPQHVAVSQDGAVLYVVTVSGVESSADQGATWPHFIHIDGVLNGGLQLAVSPTDGRHAVVLVAERSFVDRAFLFETRDALDTLADMPFIPGLAAQLRFTSIALLDDDVILVGGQSGVLRSADGGASWVESNAGIDAMAPRALPGTPIGSIMTTPASPDEVWALDGRAYRSLNAGADWMPWPASGSTPFSLARLGMIAGDPRPGKRLLALTAPPGFTSGAAMTLIELRPADVP